MGHKQPKDYIFSLYGSDINIVKLEPLGEGQWPRSSILFSPATILFAVIVQGKVTVWMCKKKKSPELLDGRKEEKFSVSLCCSV